MDFCFGQYCHSLCSLVNVLFWFIKKKRDCRFKTLLKLAIRSTLILAGSIFVVVVSNVTWGGSVIAFSLFHLLNILLFKGQRKMDTFLR